MNGTVKWFNDKKRFGFITGEDKQDYFFHHSDILTEDEFRSLDQNDLVSFDVEQNVRGKKAIKVRAE